MDQVTKQNAALLEEMAVAAISLNHHQVPAQVPAQAQVLVEAVAAFKLAADQRCLRGR